MPDLRSPPVRGDYHRWLIRVLLERMAMDQGITQESLAGAVGMHQTTIGGILNHDKGTFDLDEADAALRHVGTSLKAFVSDPHHVPVMRTPPERRLLSKLVRMLEKIPDDGLLIILDTARSVKKRSARDAGTKPAQRRAAGPLTRVRKTGGTR